MTQMDYVLAAYIVAGAGIGGLLLWAYVAMRRAEHEVKELKR
ncbi:MAG: hypothetical protein V2J26_07170 [Pacificimonas sp.]|jgi:hypothetical protein|nr:hypothetical protein [Pacificimonas sp.]